ncbi:hypothetical protein R80B4_02608 [Fibrobacteres bacterium R8-0-B4]
MSKLRPSTRFWAPAIELETHGWLIASPSGVPSLSITILILSAPNMRIRSSSIDRKNFDDPGSPWRPAPPRSWLSMRRLSWRSVPMMCRPPRLSTLSCSSAN